MSEIRYRDVPLPGASQTALGGRTSTTEDRTSRPRGPKMYRGRPRALLRRGLAQLRVAIQDRLWAEDEAFADKRGYDSCRSGGGWAITVRDPRWNSRQECSACGGTGGRIEGAECAECVGVGVVTLRPGEPGEQR